MIAQWLLSHTSLQLGLSGALMLVLGITWTSANWLNITVKTLFFVFGLSGIFTALLASHF